MTATVTDHAAARELLPAIRETRFAVEGFVAVGRFVIQGAQPALTLGKRGDGYGFAFGRVPDTFRLGAATDLAARWNETNTADPVTVVAVDEWRAARLVELADLEALILGDA